MVRAVCRIVRATETDRCLSVPVLGAPTPSEDSEGPGFGLVGTVGKITLHDWFRIGYQLQGFSLATGSVASQPRKRMGGAQKIMSLTLRRPSAR